ncbi:MAG: hypothetical protein ACHQXA_09525, partial [Gemmatimonadales bacterium]
MLTTSLPSAGAVTWLVGLLLKGTLVLLLIWSASLLLRRASAALRHLLWTVGLVALVVLPILSIALPWRLPVAAVPATAFAPPAALLAAPASEVIAPAPDEPRGAVRSRDRGQLAAAEQSTVVSPARRGPALITVLFAIWLLGTVYLLVRLALGAVVLRRIVRGAISLDTPDWR